MNELFYSKRKNVITFFSLITLIIIVGVSYAWYMHDEKGTNSQLVGGDIYLKLINGNSVNLTNVIPETPLEARSHDETNMETNNTLIFSLQGKNQKNKVLYYEITLNFGAELESPYKRFNDYDLAFDLIEMDGENEGTYLINAESFVGIDKKTIYVGSIGVNETIDKTYKLRVWLKDSVLISDTDINRSYYATGEDAFKNHYASIKIGVYGDFQEKTLPLNFYNTIKDLADDNSKTYVLNLEDNQDIINNAEWTTQDTVGVNNNKKAIYYYTGADAKKYSNVLFGGFCWQIIRTTDDGGIRLLYNGTAIDDKCPKSEDRTEIPKLIKGTDGTRSFNLGASEYVYGKGFSYSENTNTFTLNDTFSATWNDNTYKDLIGTYTCVNSVNCTTLYYVGHRQDDGTASVTTYTIVNGTAREYSRIGSSAFTAYYDSPTLVGYQYGEVYNYIKESNNQTVESSDVNIVPAIFGNDVTWDGTKYILSATKEGLDSTHHYRCESEILTDTECSVVRYYYRKVIDNNVTSYYYINLKNGKVIENAIKEMINYKSLGEIDANINKYDSAIKGLLENWYHMNLLEYDSFLDKDSVYCNNRKIASIGGWIKTGNLYGYINFKHNTSNVDLRCENDYDRFSVKNAKAKLRYPIGLLTEPERQLMGDDYANIGSWWWLGSPRYFNDNASYLRRVSYNGSSSSNYSRASGEVRPAITLHPNTTILEGTGDYDTPYIVNRVEVQ